MTELDPANIDWGDESVELSPNEQLLEWVRRDCVFGVAALDGHVTEGPIHHYYGSVSAWEASLPANLTNVVRER